MSESDVYRCQILTFEVDPRTVRVKQVKSKVKKAARSEHQIEAERSYPLEHRDVKFKFYVA